MSIVFICIELLKSIRYQAVFGSKLERKSVSSDDQNGVLRITWHGNRDGDLGGDEYNSSTSIQVSFSLLISIYFSFNFQNPLILIWMLHIFLILTERRQEDD